MTEEKKLNLGCGNDKRKNFVNCDIRPEVDPDVVCDVRNLHFSDEYADEIVAQDLLEHFENPVEVLKEWHRVLKKGGVLWLRVPDWEKVQEEEFWRNTPFENTENRVLGGRNNPYDQHKSLFTKKVLEERLELAGFKEISVRKSRKPPLHWMLLAFCRKP